MQLVEDDGSVRHLVLDDAGHAVELEAGVVPEAIFPPPKPSVGIGVRRESAFGAHLGAGFGGQIELGSDLEQNRSEVIWALERLIARTKDGDLDDLLTVAALDAGTSDALRPRD